MKKNVLAIGAHPDDIEIFCAGTLKLLLEKGWSVHIATMSPGDCGSATLSPEEISNQRVEEGKASAQKLDASFTCLQLRDFEIFFNQENLRLVTGLFRNVNPQLVLTHSPQDYIADHEETSRLVRHACFTAPVRNYLPETTPINTIPTLYYFDPAELKDSFGETTATSAIVDISTSMETKADMLACHASQRDWLAKQHGSDHYIDMMKSWSRQRGEQVKATYGEGFRQHRGHAYPQNHLLKAELGDLVH